MEQQNLETTPPVNLQISQQNPDEIINQGNQFAKKLLEIVAASSWSTKLGDKDYLHNEAWQTLGKFYGANARVRSTEYVVYGEIEGFNSIVDIVDRQGNIICSAEGSCMRDEEKWNKRPVYQWKTNPQTGRKFREKTGEETVPLFQLRSMAQTRGSSKAFRLLFGWVAVMAGFAPTPYEEMDGVNVETKPTKLQPNTITPVQVKQLLDLAARAGFDEKTARENVKNKYKKHIESLAVVEAKQVANNLKKFISDQEETKKKTEQVPFDDTNFDKEVSLDDIDDALKKSTPITTK